MYRQPLNSSVCYTTNIVLARAIAAALNDCEKRGRLADIIAAAEKMENTQDQP